MRDQIFGIKVIARDWKELVKIWQTAFPRRPKASYAAMFSYGVKLSYDQEELLADIFSTYGDDVITVTNRVFRKIRDSS